MAAPGNPLVGGKIDRSDLNIVNKLARTELDVGLTIAAASVARQLHLDWRPSVSIWSCADVIISSHSAALIEKAEELGGYDIQGLGNIIFNM